MTLGDIRRITAKLPDDTKIVDRFGCPKQYQICVKCEKVSESRDGGVKPNMAYTVRLQDT